MCSHECQGASIACESSVVVFISRRDPFAGSSVIDRPLDALGPQDCSSYEAQGWWKSDGFAGAAQGGSLPARLRRCVPAPALSFTHLCLHIDEAPTPPPSAPTSTTACTSTSKLSLLLLLRNHLNDLVRNSEILDTVATNVALGHFPKTIAMPGSAHHLRHGYVHEHVATN